MEVPIGSNRTITIDAYQSRSLKLNNKSSCSSNGNNNAEQACSELKTAPLVPQRPKTKNSNGSAATRVVEPKMKAKIVKMDLMHDDELLLNENKLDHGEIELDLSIIVGDITGSFEIMR